MNDYLIGSGAVLTAGPGGSAVAATLHAKIDPAIARSVKAALVDFEASAGGEPARVVVIASGWNARRFLSEVLEPLIACRECSLAAVLEELAAATDAGEVHVFARWLPGEVLTGRLRRGGVELISHPLGAIRQAALVSGTTNSRWRAEAWDA